MTEVQTTDTAAAVAAEGAHDAPEKASPRKGASRKKGASKGQKSAKRAAKTTRKSAKSISRKVTQGRTASKGAKILEMIGRAKGATLAEIMKESGWEAHSVRGFISTAAKKNDLQIESTKNEAGDRVYKIVE